MDTITISQLDADVAEFSIFNASRFPQFHHRFNGGGQVLGPKIQSVVVAHARLLLLCPVAPACEESRMHRVSRYRAGVSSYRRRVSLT